MSDLIQCGQNLVKPEVIIDALGPFVTDERKARMTHVLDRRIGHVALGVEDLANSFNGAACIRTAESLGVQDVVAAELRHEYPLPDVDRNPVTSGVNMYAHRWVDLHRLPTSDALIRWARQRDMRILGTSPHATATLQDVALDKPVLVLFGNERDGLREQTAAACDDVFQLPMYGFTESFNVTVSVAMTLSHLTSRLRAQWAESGQLGDLPQGRKDQLRAQWYMQTVRRAPLIVSRFVDEQRAQS